jgi:asparagine synthase (glutamine-hydrolysing)
VGTRHVERVLTFTDLEETLQILGRHFDEPFADSSAIATYAVCGVAREAVTVGLSGDGGDEVLAGYTRYQGEKFSATWATLPALMRRGLVPRCLGLARRLSRGDLWLRLDRAARVVDAANMSFEARTTQKHSWSTVAHRALLLRGGHAIRPAREFIEEVMRDCPARDSFHRLNWLDLRMTLPSQMLTKVDRMSMAHSLEVRVPFLDHRLVELMAPVSAQVKLPGYRRKHVLRRAMAGRLPSEVIRGPKRGFNVPVREWFQDEASQPLLARHFAAPGLDDFLDRRALQDVLETHRRGREDHGALIWILLQLATWCARSGGVSQQV